MAEEKTKWNNSMYVPLHNHSEMSPLDGLSSVKDLAHTARKMGFPAIAITDHGNVSGWLKFIQECEATKDKKDNPIPYPTIKPILGIETYLSRYISGNKENQPEGIKCNRHLILLAKNWEGYKNLCTLSQLAWTDGYYLGDPRIDIDALSKYSNGLICSSACLKGIINANLACDKYDKAKQAAGILKDIFGDDFYLEVMYHGIENEQKIIPLILSLGKELNIKVFASQDSHYIRKDQARSHEVLICMSIHSAITAPNHLQQDYDEAYLKSAEEMAYIFGDYPQLLLNTLEVADKVDFKEIRRNLFSRGMSLPKIDIPKEFKTPYDYMAFLAWEGMKKYNWDKDRAHVDALKMELRDVKVALENNNYDFSTYFLIVRDYVQYAKNSGIRVGSGRGSGYASILLRCLGITYGADPVKYGAIWSRFLAFTDLRFMKESDLGFDDGEAIIPESLVTDDLDEERDIEDDPGGVDRI